MNADEYIVQTKRWIQSVVVECNFCPFAKRELERESIRYVIADELELELCLERIFEECVFLDSSNNVETTLVIFSNALKSFDDFLSCVEIAEQLLTQHNYDGIYQLASFHPEYCFSGADDNDAANYTNRSPHPMLQILRESSIETALAHFTDPTSIPERNVEYARDAGLDVMKARLESCRHE